MTKLFFSVFCLLPALLFGQSKNEQIKALFELHHAASDLEGVLLVAEGGNVIYEGAIGFADANANTPLTTGSRMPITAMTQLFTAVLIMQLEDEKLLTTEQTIRELWPDFPAAYGDKVTLHQLLTHTSGLPEYESKFELPQDAYAPLTSADDFIATHLMGELQSAPGSTFRDNAGDFVILGRIVEILRKKPFHEVLQHHILDKSGMPNTGVLRAGIPVPGLVKGCYNFSNLNGQCVNMKTEYIQNYFAAGAMWSTVSDLLSFDEALHNEAILSEIAQKKLFSGNRKMNYLAYGCWSYSRHAGDRFPTVVERYGKIGPFSVAFMRFQQDRHAIIFLGNNGTFDPDQFMDQQDIKEQLTMLLFDQPYKKPVVNGN